MPARATMNQLRVIHSAVHDVSHFNLKAPAASRLGLLFHTAFRNSIAAGALALALLSLGTATCQAQGEFYWIPGSGLWTNPVNWSSNGVAGVAFPGDPTNPNSLSDGAFITNAGTYTVTLDTSPGGF